MQSLFGAGELCVYLGLETLVSQARDTQMENTAILPEEI